MDESEECITALRFKMQMDVCFMGTDEGEKNLCGGVDHQTKKIRQMKLFINKKNHLMHRAWWQHFGMFGGLLLLLTTDTDLC